MRRERSLLVLDKSLDSPVWSHARVPIGEESLDFSVDFRANKATRVPRFALGRTV